MAQAELNFSDYLRIFRKRKLTIFLTFLFVVLASFSFSSSRAPVYVSEAKVKIVERRTMVSESIIETVSVGDFIATNEEIIKGRLVAEKAARELNLIHDGMSPQETDAAISQIQGAISTSRVRMTNVIQIIATTGDPKASQDIAEAVAKAFIQQDLEDKSKEVTSVRIFIEKELEKATQHLEEIQTQLAESQVSSGGERVSLLQGELSKLQLERETLLLKATERHPQVAMIDEQIETLKKQLAQLPKEDKLKLESLKREMGDSINLVSHLKQKYNDAKIKESEKVSEISIVDHARGGALKLGSSRKTNVMFGGIIGLLLGCVFGFIKEGLDTSIGAIEDVESFLGISVLGVIPHMAMPRETEKKRSLFSTQIRPSSQQEKIQAMRSRLVTQLDPRSAEAEAYQTLRTNLYSTVGEKGHLMVLFTSSGPREGKSIASANFAVASAQMGKKTLLMDADLRRPVIHQIFGLDRGPGLFELITGALPIDKVLKNIADILIGDVEWEKTLRIPHMAYLNLITAGHLPPNPPELLNSQEMGEILQKLRNDFDLVILDCPPVLPVADALILGPKVDGVILVYQTGRTARKALKRTKMQLDTAKAKVLGVVLNDVRAVEMEAGSSYYYRYRKYYSDAVKKDRVS